MLWGCDYIVTNQKLNQIAEQLNKSNEYRVIRKYIKPEFYNDEGISSNTKRIGVFLDVESTGLSYSNNKLIELGMVKFEYTEDGRIFRLLDEFNGYQDPKVSIPEHITKLTGITNDMVAGQHIDERKVTDYLHEIDLVIAHNALFDRAFFETTFPNTPPKAWACSMSDIHWKDEDISSFKLEYIAYRYNFFYEGHRAIVDCLAGIHILSQTLHVSKELVLKSLLDNSLQLRFLLWAVNSPYDCKELLKERGYRWMTRADNDIKAWCIESPEDEVSAEIKYLRSDIYKKPFDIPIEIFDSCNRFSIKKDAAENLKYEDKVLWAKALCKER